MVRPQVELVLSGINKVMTSPAVQADLKERGDRMAAAAGPEFEAVSRPHRWTARVYVRPKSARGARQEARDKRLVRSIDAGR